MAGCYQWSAQALLVLASTECAKVTIGADV